MLHDLRALLRLASGCASDPTAAVLDSRTLRSTPESGHRAGYDDAKRENDSKVHAAVDTPPATCSRCAPRHGARSRAGGGACWDDAGDDWEARGAGLR